MSYTEKSSKFNYFCRDIATDVGLFSEIVKIFRVLGKIRDIFHGPHRKFAWFVVVTTSVFIFLWIVGPGNTFIHWIKAGLEIKRQESQIEQYRKEIEQMDKHINMLKTDRDTLEKFAREQFNFAAPGDDVYIIEED